TRAQTLDHFERMDGLTPARTAGYLEVALARGIIHEVREGEAMFDLLRLTDWLRENTPYLQSVYTNDLSEALFDRDPDIDKPSSLHCMASYEVCFDGALLSRLPEAMITLPLPIQYPWQEQLLFRAVSPAWLAESIRLAKDDVTIPLLGHQTPDPI